MKIIISILFSIITISCSATEYDISGVWAFIDTYYYWKEGEQEDISATSVNIGGTRYLALTNSVYISTDENNKYLQVPGGKWLIENIIKENDFSYVLDLSTIKDERTKGRITVHFIDTDLIYFSVGSMDNKFKYEFDQSFLMLDEKNIYRRCDTEQ
jgi:hypothetical protein